MLSRTVSTLMILSILALSACTPAKPPPEEGPGEPGEHPAATVDEIPPLEPEAEVLPFTLIVNEEVVGPDLRCSVPEGQVVIIQYVASEVVTCELRVQPPGGAAIVLGSWQADTAYFNYSFPYGENHLILGCDDSIYDVLVIAGAPEGGGTSKACSGAYLDLNPNTRLEYEETAATSYPKYWLYRVTDWTIQDSTATLTFLMERSTGVERKPEATVTLNLACAGDLILISRAVEQEGGKISTTLYEEGTVFMPPVIKEGVQWERHGTTEVEYEDQMYAFNLTERFKCSGEESVSVKAGEFTAARVEYSISGSGEDEEYAYSGESWFVPGLGRILVMDDTEEKRKLELVAYEGVLPR